MPSHAVVHQRELDEVLVPGVLSLIGSCSIILTYLLFSDLRRLRYVEFVFYVAVNCLIAAIGACMGNVSHNAAACYFQDVTTSANNVSAVFWAVVITYQLYIATVNMGQTLKDIRGFHLVCWLLPWVLVFLPLTTNTFGIPDKGGTWCFIDNRKNSPQWGIVTWEIVSVYAPILISIVIMSALLISVAVQINTNTLSELMIVALKKLYLYPIVFVVCWVPSLVCNIYIAASSNTGDISPILRGFANVCPVLQGFLVAVVFFTHNRIVRDHWLHYLKIYQLMRQYSVSSMMLRGSIAAGRGASDDDDHKIKVMMRAENESDYIDDETRAAFAFRVSFSSNSSNNFLGGNEFRSSDISILSSSTLSPMGNNNNIGDSRDSSVFVLSSSQQDPYYVGGNGNGRGTMGSHHGIASSPMDSNASSLGNHRGTLSSQPKQSFLHNNFLYSGSLLSSSSSSSSRFNHNNNNSSLGVSLDSKSAGSNPHLMAASLSSSPPGADPDTLLRNDRSIQMSVTSISTASSSTAVNRLRNDQQLLQSNTLSNSNNNSNSNTNSNSNSNTNSNSISISISVSNTNSNSSGTGKTTVNASNSGNKKEKETASKNNNTLIGVQFDNSRASEMSVNEEVIVMGDDDDDDDEK